MKLKVLVCPEEVGGFSVSVPALPGCYSQGEILAEALDNIREAADFWLEVAAENTEAQAGIASNLTVVYGHILPAVRGQ